MPLISAGVTAAFPRYGGPAAQAGLEAYGLTQRFARENRYDQMMRAEHGQKLADEEALSKALSAPEAPSAYADYVQGAQGPSAQEAGGLAPGTPVPSGNVSPRAAGVQNAARRSTIVSTLSRTQPAEAARLALERGTTPEEVAALSGAHPGLSFSGRDTSGMLIGEKPTAQSTALHFTEFTDATGKRWSVGRDDQGNIKSREFLGQAKDEGQQSVQTPIIDAKTGKAWSFDSRKRQYVEVPVPPGATLSPKTDEEKNIEIAAQALAGGDLSPIKDIASWRGDQRLRIFARVKELNPKFSIADMNRKIAMEQSATVGKDGQQIQSFGTFLEHAGEASDVINGIYQSGTPALNKPLNWWRKNMAGSADYQQLVTALEPVRKEFEGFLLGGRALYGDDRQKAEMILSDNSSPAQINSALKQMGKTARDRFTEINQRYRRVMGKDIENPFGDEAVAGAAKIGLKIGSQSPVASANRPPLSSFFGGGAQAPPIPSPTPGPTRPPLESFFPKR